MIDPESGIGYGEGSCDGDGNGYLLSARFAMDYIVDPIERGETRCEDWAAENLRGDEMTCCCGKTCKLDEAETLSPDPYAIPVCPECFDQAMDKKFGPSWRDKM